MHASNPVPPAGNALAGPSPPGPARPQYINQPEHDMASSMNFRKDVNLPARAHEPVMSRIPRTRRPPGDLAALVSVLLAAGAAAPAALARRAVGPA
jgi:hypothetical protein